MKRFILSVAFLFATLTAQDKFANFAQGILYTGISSSDTQLTLISGQGARFPSTGNYNRTIWDYSAAGWNITGAYQNSKAEIVRVTANTANVLTIQRAQEGTTARSFNAAGHTYYVILSATAKAFTDLQDSVTALRSSSATFSDSLTARRTFEFVTRDSITSHNSRINALSQNTKDSVAALRASILLVSSSTDSITALRSAINKNIDSITAHNTRINANAQKVTDSTSAHRTAINSLITTTDSLRSNIAKVYRAIITYNGSFTTTVVKNTLGVSPTIARSGTGTFTVTATNAFVSNKTTVLLTPSGTDVGNYDFFGADITSTSVVTFYHLRNPAGYVDNFTALKLVITVEQ